MKTNNSSTLFKALSYTGLKHLSISPNKRRLAVVKFYTKNKEVMYDTLCKWDISNPEFPKRIFKMAIKADPYKIVPTGCNDFICVYKQHICGPNGTILHKLKDDNEVYTYVGDNRLTKTMGLCTLLVAVYNKATNRSSLDVL